MRRNRKYPREGKLSVLSANEISIIPEEIDASRLPNGERLLDGDGWQDIQGTSYSPAVINGQAYLQCEDCKGLQTLDYSITRYHNLFVRGHLVRRGDKILRTRPGLCETCFLKREGLL
jgi:hypothetical protein